MQWILPLALLITFELVADILAKEWSLRGNAIRAAGALMAYLLANSFWLFALKNGSGLARGAVIFSVASGIIALVLGVVFYKEALSKTQTVGLILGLVALGLIFWND